MPRKTPLHYTDEMKSHIWNRYKTGDPFLGSPFIIAV